MAPLYTMIEFDAPSESIRNVRDECVGLPRCLTIVACPVDEIGIVDTVSQDGIGTRQSESSA